MIPAYLRRLASLSLACIAIIAIVTAGSAGKAWCRADPVLIIGKDVVDIQVASNLKMYQSATGPIELVVKVRPGTKARVVLNDFGFGHGYNIRIEEDPSVPAGLRARAVIYAPASDGSLPVSVVGTRATVNLVGLLKLRPNILWTGQANGNANQWVTLDIR